MPTPGLEPQARRSYPASCVLRPDCTLAEQRLDVSAVGAAAARLECFTTATGLPLAGQAPIYVGSGSMGGFDPEALRDVLLSAIAGQRRGGIAPAAASGPR